MLVVSLGPIACVTGLIFISTTSLAQNSSTGDIQSEIAAVDRKIVPANSSTVDLLLLVPILSILLIPTHPFVELSFLIRYRQTVKPSETNQ